MVKRNETRKIFVGGVQIGGQNKVVIQSMTNTKTKDVKATVEQILKLEEAGCEIIRVACLDEEDARAIKEIKKQIHIPVVADIHFNYRIALEAAKAGVDKIRINPGNIGSIDRVKHQGRLPWFPISAAPPCPPPECRGWAWGAPSWAGRRGACPPPR